MYDPLVVKKTESFRHVQEDYSSLVERERLVVVILNVLLQISTLHVLHYHAARLIDRKCLFY